MWLRCLSTAALLEGGGPTPLTASSRGPTGPTPPLSAAGWVGGPPGRRRATPLDGELARANSAYASFVGGVLVREPSGESVTPLEEFVHDSLRGLVLNPRFSCVGAKAAIRRGQYRAGLYGTMGSHGAMAGLARDLFEFVEDLPSIDGGFTTFLASFRE